MILKDIKVFSVSLTYSTRWWIIFWQNKYKFSTEFVFYMRIWEDFPFLKYPIYLFICFFFLYVVCVYTTMSMIWFFFRIRKTFIMYITRDIRTNNDEYEINRLPVMIFFLNTFFAFCIVFNIYVRVSWL